jgi:hypothetical protein
VPEYRILIAVSAAREYEGLAESTQPVGIGAPRTPRDWPMAMGVEFRMVSPELEGGDSQRRGV